MDGKDTRTGIFIERNGERREIRVDALDPVVAAVYRTWDSAKRLEAAHQQAVGARRLLVAQLRALNPEWTEEQVRAEVRRRFLAERG